MSTQRSRRQLVLALILLGLALVLGLVALDAMRVEASPIGPPYKLATSSDLEIQLEAVTTTTESEVTITVTISNNGPDVNADGAFTLTVEPAVSTNFPYFGGGCNLTVNSKVIYSCDLPFIAAAADPVSATLDLMSVPTGTYTITAEVADGQNDSVADNNIDQVVVEVSNGSNSPPPPPPPQDDKANVVITTTQTSAQEIYPNAEVSISTIVVQAGAVSTTLPIWIHGKISGPGKTIRRVEVLNNHSADVSFDSTGLYTVTTRLDWLVIAEIRIWTTFSNPGQGFTVANGRIVGDTGNMETDYSDNIYLREFVVSEWPFKYFLPLILR
jgi:hypothetical protein